MKVTWHRFREQQPKNLSLIWFCRDGIVGKALIQYVLGATLLESETVHWAYAELPEPPEEESHYCRSIDDNGIQWTCKDDKVPGLFTLSKKKNGVIELEVPFCPFCGEEARYTEEQRYEDKEKEEDDE